MDAKSHSFKVQQVKIIKSIILMLTVGYLVRAVSSNESILSKFHQNRYKIKDPRLQLVSYEKLYFNLFEIKSFKYNRTITAHNGTFNSKIDFKDEMEVLVQCYKFLSNEYRRIAMRFQLNVKKAVDSNAAGVLDEIRKCGNATSFYFLKNITYYFCNLVCDEKHLPPLIPDGRYKTELTLLYWNKEIARIDMFGEVWTPIPYPKI